jgi:hypothetical protein
MADEIGVCNQALAELGESFIQSFSDGTSVANVCATLYPDVRDEVLELHPWNFATYRTRLSRSPDTPAMDYQYMYPLPSNPWCIKVQGTDEGNGARFNVGMDRFNTRVLYSDQGSVSIVYTARVTDLGVWAPLALQILVKLLASRLAKVLTGQNSLAQLKFQEAVALLPEARSADGREGYPVVLRPNTRLTRRRQTHGGVLQAGLVRDA